ncbi:ABC transporter ATP-binding protein [Cohnella soli]|uniref:ABC transporter ATP-binding protein n=1 Tax=Cohnella soli TaxID=425005 RepID=A0ABW0HXU8_9BACL
MIRGEHLAVAYRGHTVMNDVSVEFEAGLVHSILGPNGCGKSTLLKVLSRQLPSSSGAVLVEGKDANSWGTKPFARHLAMLSQAQERMTDISVYDLVSYGRFPHKGWMQKLDDHDRAVVEQALQLTGTSAMSGRSVLELSGGERQRVRIAMAVAQQPKALLLDEPTTYLDICHQLEIMELVRELNRDQRMTVIMVLHDLNHASLYSDRVTVMKQGTVYGHGTPEEVISEQMLRDVFQVESSIERDRTTNRPLIRTMKLQSSG